MHLCIEGNREIKRKTNYDVADSTTKITCTNLNLKAGRFFEISQKIRSECPRMAEKTLIGLCLHNKRGFTAVTVLRFNFWINANHDISSITITTT